MAAAAVFPAFIRATYQETSEGVPAFERAIQSSVNRARKIAEISMDDITREIERTTAGGSRDLGVKDLRSAAAAADARAQSSRLLANAIAATAAAEADYSAVTQVSIAAARRMAENEEQAARTAHLHASAMERVADAARRNNIDMSTLASGHGMATRSVGAHRQAQMMLGQQLQDTAIMMQLGMNPLMILTQQGTQAAFALTQMGGKAAAVGRFFSSPWTAALLVAGTALSALMTEADNASDSLEKIRFSSDSVGDAQSILGGAMDLTTGKINTQSEATMNLARAHLAVARVTAQARMADARAQIKDAGKLGFTDGFYGSFSSNKTLMGSRVTRDLLSTFLAGGTDAKSTLRSLEEFNNAGLITSEVFTTASAAVANFGMETQNIKTFEAAQRMMEGIGGRRDRQLLLKPAKPAAKSKAANDNDRQRLFDNMMGERLEAQGNVQKLANQMVERNLEWGKDLVTVGEQQLELEKQKAALVDAQAEGARQILDYTLRQLDAVQRSGGLVGGVAGIVSGMATGDFYGVNGPIGRMLNIASPMIGQDGWKDVTSKLDEIFGGNGMFEQSMTSLLQGAGIGTEVGGLVLGANNSKIGSAVGGALGKEAGSALTKGMSGFLGKLGGPLGSIAGGIIGGAVGNLFTSPKWGTAVLGGNAKGDVSVSGNKSAYRSNAGLAGTSIQTGLDRIAEQFGVDVGGYNVSIGQYKGKWRVSTSGRSGSLKGGSGRTDIKDFGENGGEDAVKFAIADAVKDGALIGLRASTQALLSASSDVEAQLQKALDFESVFSRLKAYKDPVSAAMETMDKEFGRLKKIFGEAGASAEEYAQLEELYGIERANAVKEAGERVTASLKSLFDDLTVGNDARSLRDRLAEAQAKYDPLAQRVAGGDTSAYDDYSDVARTMLDLQRQISGSGEDYFKLLDQVTALTKTRIDSETNVASIAADRPGLFASDSSLAPVVSATETQTSVLSKAIADGFTSLGGKLDVLNENTLRQGRAASAGSSTSNSIGFVDRQNF